MTSENAYRDLADRVEGATVAALVLDEAVGLVFFDGAKTDVTGIIQIGQIERRPFRVPAYSASLDAARSLVPEPGKWSITSGTRGGWEAAVWLVDGLALDWRTAATPALALTAAALRAHAARIGRVG